MSKEATEDFASNLTKALKRARNFDYFDYAENGDAKPLWALLGYADMPSKELLQAVLVKFAREQVPNSTDSDILLIAFGLLKGYEDEPDVGNRRRRCIDYTDYFKHEKPEDYESYMMSNVGEERNELLKNATERLRKKEDRLLYRLACAVEEILDLSMYVAQIDGYITKEKPFKVNIPLPNLLLQIKGAELSHSASTSHELEMASAAKLTESIPVVDSVKEVVLKSTDLIISKIDALGGNSSLELAFRCPAPIPRFIGRDDELCAIGHRLEHTGHVLISGVNGIGKTEIAKRFAQLSSDKYNMVCFLSYDKSLIATIGRQISVLGYTSDGTDIDGDYTAKMDILRHYDKQLLLVIDNFEGYLSDSGAYIPATFDPQYGEVCAGRYHKIFISNRGSEDCFELSPLPEQQQVELFLRHYKRGATYAEMLGIRKLLKFVGGHTLTIELIAKNLYLDRRMSVMDILKCINVGVHSVSVSIKLALESIFNISKLSNDEKYILANMTLAPDSGIPTLQFGDWIGLSEFDALQNLIDSNWIQIAVKDDIISLQPVISSLIIDALRPNTDKCRKYLDALVMFSSCKENFNSVEKRHYSSKLINAAVARIHDNSHIANQLLDNDFTYNQVYDHYRGRAADWGPDRTTFAWDNPAPYAVFNSITDNPDIGDERFFVRIRPIGKTYAARAALLEPGKSYEVLSYYHNNAGEEYAYKAIGTAVNARMSASFPARIRAGERKTINTVISAADTDPLTVWAGVSIMADQDLYLRYIPGSTIIHNSGELNGRNVSPDHLFSKKGALLGYNIFRGLLPGTNEYSGWISYRFVADYVEFILHACIRDESGNELCGSLNAKSVNKVIFEIDYINDGSMTQVGVVLRAELPSGMEYINGSSTLKNNSSNFQAHTISDNIITPNGTNVGSYGKGGRATLCFGAYITDKATGVMQTRISCNTEDTNQTVLVDIEFA